MFASPAFYDQILLIARTNRRKKQKMEKKLEKSFLLRASSMMFEDEAKSGTTGVNKDLYIGELGRKALGIDAATVSQISLRDRIGCRTPNHSFPNVSPICLKCSGFQVPVTQQKSQ